MLVHCPYCAIALRLHGHALADEPVACDLRGFARRVWHLATAVQLHHHHAGERPSFHQIEDTHEIDLTEPEGTVASHRWPAHPILDVHVLHDRQEVLHH